ncbi:hypothetical protein EO244_16475 [Ancylomarina salipaludis]|uniref:Lipoprotein n=1 Tax=Ancylomarina salipaludis TaxID=2501299 RepID=A0A4Q1JIR9_9BACT|nr:hypothetical protein [Ancylomarina salipaludis]RXQ87402.1 hypothetical protein EO244_16475 [Ancylomarina salipaludis]
MKNKTFLLTLILLIFIGCAEKSNFKALTAQSSDLKGQIKSLTEKRYSAQLIDGTIQEVKEKHTGKIEIKKFFDKENRLEKSKYFGENGNLHSIVKIRVDHSYYYLGSEGFDDTNKLIFEDKVTKSTENSFIVERFNVNSNTLVQSEMVYDKNRLCTLLKTQINDSTSIAWEYKRDESGRILYTNTINKFGQQVDTSLLFAKYLDFDHKGNWTKRIDYKKGQEDKVYVFERIIEYPEK